MFNISFKSFNQRGQAETVFEVLIAVILLSFVILVGSYAMNSLSDTKCSKETDIALSNFAIAIERTASSSLSTQETLFDLPNCFGMNANAKLTKFTESSICSTYCPGSLGTCMLLQYNNDKDKISPVRYRCVNISPLTIFNSTTECNVDDKYSFPEADQSNTWVLKRGNYKIESVSLTSPTMCILKRQT